jgi:hypothetical protein
VELPPGGVEMTDEEMDDRWDAWTPTEVARRLAGVATPWAVAGGWSLDLFLGRPTRAHDDIEITTPARSFPTLVEAFDDFEWDVVGSGRRWPFPVGLDVLHQTWLRDPTTDRYHLDVFREPHDGATWIYRRHPAIRMPYADVHERSAAGVPFVAPEVTLLFKAKACREKDQADFDVVRPALDGARHRRLRGWLIAAHPGHAWIDELA